MPFFDEPFFIFDLLLPPFVTLMIIVALYRFPNTPGFYNLVRLVSGDFKAPRSSKRKYYAYLAVNSFFWAAAFCLALYWRYSDAYAESLYKNYPSQILRWISGIFIFGCALQAILIRTKDVPFYEGYDENSRGNRIVANV